MLPILVLIATCHVVDMCNDGSLKKLSCKNDFSD